MPYPGEFLNPNSLPANYLALGLPPVREQNAYQAFRGGVAQALSEQEVAQQKLAASPWGQALGNAMLAMQTMGPGRAPPMGRTPTLGIRAYHVSPYEFEKFDLSKVGSGQGAQSYGHGLYFAENPKVSGGPGSAYWNEFAPRYIQKGGPEGLATEALLDAKGDRTAAIGALQNRYVRVEEAPPVFKNRQEAEAFAKQRGITDFKLEEVPWFNMEGVALRVRDPGPANQAIELLQSGAPVGPRTYEANIRANPEQFMEWDTPLNEQSASVQEALKKLGTDEVLAKKYPGLPAAIKYLFSGETSRGEHGATLHPAINHLFSGKTFRGEHVSSLLTLGATGNREATAELLRRAGIPGVRYADQGSRGNLVQLERDLAEVRQAIADVEKQTGATRDMRLENLRRDEANLARDAEYARNPTYNYVVNDDSIVDILKRYGLLAAPAAGVLGMNAGREQ